VHELGQLHKGRVLVVELLGVAVCSVASSAAAGIRREGITGDTAERGRRVGIRNLGREQVRVVVGLITIGRARSASIARQGGSGVRASTLDVVANDLAEAVLRRVEVRMSQHLHEDLERQSVDVLERREAHELERQGLDGLGRHDLVAELERLEQVAQRMVVHRLAHKGQRSLAQLGDHELLADGQHVHGALGRERDRAMVHPIEHARKDARALLVWEGQVRRVQRALDALERRAEQRVEEARRSCSDADHEAMDVVGVGLGHTQGPVAEGRARVATPALHTELRLDTCA